MNVTAKLSDLNAVLSRAIRVVPKQTTMPVLEHICLSAQDGMLSCVTTDLQLFYRTQCPATIHESGAVLVPARVLSDIVKSLLPRGGDLELTISDTTEGRVALKCGAFTSKVFTFTAEDYPRFPSETCATDFTIHGDTLRTMLNRVKFATHDDESRMILCGAYCEWDGTTLAMVATDTHRLSLVKTTDGVTTENTSFNFQIPTQLIDELVRLTAESYHVTVSEGSIYVDTGDSQYIARMITGQYPDYNRVIPAKANYRWTVSRTALRDALRRTEIAGKTGTHKVVVSTTKDGLHLCSTSEEIGEIQETVPYEGTAEDGFITAYNAQYLQQVLDTISTADIVSLYSEGALNPAKMTFEGEEQYTYIVMPMQLL